ncbi:MAG: HAMP domain-containing histidine kinase [Labilithrix sp.]|nr:HAMP domain-containing histidine kinase [Labilithrix sp.]MCW5811559.1 HAMP domain-containing histidine kinase [Labilithrix sp.]
MLAAFLAALGAALTTRWIASRVTLLRNGTRAIGRGDLNARIPIEGHDEFAEIARGVHEMAASLQRHHDEMLRAQRLASIGQVAAGVAHEINNPLGVILGFVKTMRRSDRRDDEGLDVIEEETKQCKRIVEGLLDLARPQGLAVETFDVVKLLQECVDRLRSSGRFDEISFVVPAGGPISAIGDPGRLRQVFSNVIANAAEAVRPGGHVSVVARSWDAGVEVTVSDDGPGIARDVRNRLFEPFVTTKAGGVGLGLAIAHAIVDAHSGTIDCGDAPSGGTTMRIVLPLDASKRAA